MLGGVLLDVEGALLEVGGATAPPLLAGGAASTGDVTMGSTESLEQAVASANTAIAERAIERRQSGLKLTWSFMCTQQPTEAGGVYQRSAQN